MPNKHYQLNHANSNITNSTMPKINTNTNNTKPKLKSKQGHRERLRKRFLKDNGNSMHDYELLELLLMNAIPRQDVKPLAKSLINQFNSFAECIQAENTLLEAHPECGEAVITTLKSTHAAAIRLLREEAFNNEHILDGWDKLLDYCQALLAREKIEQLRCLFVDRKNRLISDEKIHQGTLDQAPFYPREIIKRTLELSAAGLILVHNHPTGDPKPSRADIDTTRNLKTALDILEIKLHDHIIVAKTGYTSMRAQGLI